MLGVNVHFYNIYSQASRIIISLLGKKRCVLDYIFTNGPGYWIRFGGKHKNIYYFSHTFISLLGKLDQEDRVAH